MNSGSGRRFFWWGLGIVVGIAVGALALHALHWYLASPSERTIRAYQVDPEVAEELRVALNSAIDTGSKDAQTASRVVLASDGRLLVTAPESIQRGVERIIADVAKQGLTATPTIKFEIWLVTARPGDAALTPNLSELEPALAAISKAQAQSLHFQLYEKAATQVRSGQTSRITGKRTAHSIVPSIRRNEKGDSIVAANLRISVNNQTNDPAGISTQVELRPGELLVLGQSSMPMPMQFGPEGERGVSDEQLYIIIRASL